MNPFTPLQLPSSIQLPQAFPNPFRNLPHPIAQFAAKQLQARLPTQWKNYDEGNMFGVLVVRDSEGSLGYLAGFRGETIVGLEDIDFVPPILPLQIRNELQTEFEDRKQTLRDQLSQLENDGEYHALKQAHAKTKHESERSLTDLKESHRQKKNERSRQRKAISPRSCEQALLDKLAAESIADKIVYKEQQTYWQEQIDTVEQALSQFDENISTLRNSLLNLKQEYLDQFFTRFEVKSFQEETRSLSSLLNGQIPLAGTGDCAAPKLLHYAQDHQLDPIALAEFWWGPPPKGEVRQHGRCYPPCRGKCSPVLPFMLEGVKQEKVPPLGSGISEEAMTTVYEDEHLIVVDKPAGLLSVPGHEVKDSVLIRLQRRFPDATGPLLVHRLDLSTSGLLIAAKSSEVHKALQQQFIRRTVKKRYVALLEGVLEKDSGIIDLPLRIDFADRPRQMICDIYGKPAQTKWQVLERSDGQTRVQLFPLTGRTHQLRVHSAYPEGLNHPIVGDELYGEVGDRLCLHAESLNIQHPITKQTCSFFIQSPF